MFTSQEDEILKELLLHIPSLKQPNQTPHKKHTLPDAIKNQLYQLLLQEHPEWPKSKSETERRLARLNREQYVPPIENAKEKTNNFMKRLFAAKKEEPEDSSNLFGSPTPSNLLKRMELDTPTKPKASQRTSTKLKKRIDLEEYMSKKRSPSPAPPTESAEFSSPTKRTKPIHIDNAPKTPVKATKKIVGKRKVVPVFSPAKSDSTNQSPSKDVVAVVPEGDPFYSPKKELLVPDISETPKPLFEPVFHFN